MVSKIKKLPAVTQQLLKLAAAMGNRFERDFLAVVAKQTIGETNNNLQKAIAFGLIYTLDDTICKIVDVDLLERLDIECEYKFAHDKIQQAAYSLISEQDKPSVHWQMGELLLQHTSVTGLEQKIFDIVNQLNLGIRFVNSQSQQINIANLNLMAAKKAKAAAAYQPACEYLKVSLNLLPKDSWENHYDLTLFIYLEAAEIAYLRTNFEQTSQLAAIVMQQARSLQDKIKIYEIKIQAAEAQNEFKVAINLALEALSLLGVNLPEHPSKLQLALALLKIKIALAFKSSAELIALPIMTDANKIAAMSIMKTVKTAAYIINPLLLFLMTLKRINLSLKYGNALTSPYAYFDYSLFLINVVKNIKAAYEMGQFALKLIDKLDAVEFAIKTKLMVYAFLNHWQKPLNQTLSIALDFYYKALETGDLEYSGYSINTYCFYAYFCGEELTKLEQEMVEYSQVLAKVGQNLSFHQNILYRQVILNLLGKTENPCKLSGEAYDEDVMLPLHQKANERIIIFYFYFHKLILCYLLEEYTLAVENAALTEKYINGVTGSLFETLFYFYDSLAKLAICDRLSKIAQQRMLIQVALNQKKMQKWAHHSPKNYLHKYYLVAAEVYRIKGQKDLAIEHYDRAVAHARMNKYINEEALAQELTAKFYIKQQKEAIAKAYMREAIYCYTRWGAKVKVTDLETRYPKLISKVIIPTSETLFNNFELKTYRVNSEALDLATVTKASQTISSEIALDRLLTKLIKIAIENAGAQSGILIL